MEFKINICFIYVLSYTGAIKYISNENNIQKLKQGDLCDYYYVKMI